MRIIFLSLFKRYSGNVNWKRYFNLRNFSSTLSQTTFDLSSLENVKTFVKVCLPTSKLNVYRYSATRRFRREQRHLSPKSCHPQVFDLCESVQICRIFADMCRSAEFLQIFAGMCTFEKN